MRCIEIEVCIKQVLITSVSSSDYSYLQFAFDFMTLTHNIKISYFEQKRKSYLKGRVKKKSKNMMEFSI